MNNYQNLSVPFNIPIPGGMHSGKMVTVQGKIPPTSQRFAVNLLCRSGDIALHVCPKFKENCVVRNNVLNMNWGPEERHGTIPIQPGQQFEMLILCEVYDFKIAFNGYHFTQFSHRVPFSSITNLAVDGEVLVFDVSFKEQNGPGNNLSNNTGYGFQPASPTPSYQPGGLYPTINPPSPNKNTGLYPTSGSLYPTQPGYGNIPQHGPYPQTPSSNYGGHSPNSHYGGPTPNTNYGGHSPTPHSKPGILEQAGMAVAGILGPGLLAGGMNRKCNTQSPSCGKTNLLDDAGRALAGVFGVSGLTGSGTTQKGIQSHTPTPQAKPGFLGQAGSALAGVLGGAGLMGSGHRNQNNLGGLGGILGTAAAGAALSGHLNPIKAAKKQRKAQKKALKYGLPIAGAGLGAYALHKGLKGFRRSSSSSSCSSSD